VARLHRLPELALIDMGDFAGATLKYLRRHPVARLTLAGGFASSRSSPPGSSTSIPRAAGSTPPGSPMRSPRLARHSNGRAAHAAVGAGEVLELAGPASPPRSHAGSRSSARELCWRRSPVALQSTLSCSTARRPHRSCRPLAAAAAPAGSSSWAHRRGGDAARTRSTASAPTSCSPARSPDGRRGRWRSRAMSASAASARRRASALSARAGGRPADRRDAPLCQRDLGACAARLRSNGGAPADAAPPALAAHDLDRWVEVDDLAGACCGVGKLGGAPGSPSAPAISPRSRMSSTCGFWYA